MFFCIVLFYVVFTGIGYVLVQHFDPAANEPMGWFVYGGFAFMALVVALLALALLVCAVVGVFNFVRRVLGKGLIGDRQLGRRLASPRRPARPARPQPGQPPGERSPPQAART